MQEQQLEFKARLLTPEGREGTDPRHSKVVRILSRLAGAVAIGTLLYTFLVRPWHLRWGATEEEAASVLPGDELMQQSQMQSTRAITIEASAAEIWPWLVQMGQGRGGLYSYDWLENLAGCDIHSVDTIVPNLQQLQVGDTFRLGPEGYPFFLVASIRPEHEIVLISPPAPHDAVSPESSSVAGEHVPQSTWAFVLQPIDEKKTRLLIRLRGDWEGTIGMTLFNRAILEPAHFVMERKMIYGIKERAEQDAVAE